jgi:hypothetical protein
VLLCLDVRSLALYLYPSRRCVLVSGWLHLVHIIGLCELCLFLHRYTCDPHATSYPSRMYVFGGCENACMMKSDPVSLASLRRLPKTPLRGTVLLVCFSSFLILALRLVICWMFPGLFGGVCLICGHVRRPPIHGSASLNTVSGAVSPSTTALAALSVVSFYSTSVCDLTFPMCVFSCFESLSRSSWLVSCRRSLCRWCF